jgi:hypothetical protein
MWCDVTTSQADGQLKKTLTQRDRQCTYDVTWRRVRAAIVAVEEQYYIFWVCLCSLRYPACNAHASYFHLWPVRLYYIFPRLVNGTIFGKKKKLLNTKCVWIFSTNFVWNISRSKKNSTYFGLHVKGPHSFEIVLKLEVSRQIFEKYSSEISWYFVQCEPSCSMQSLMCYINRLIQYTYAEIQTQMNNTVQHTTLTYE